MNAPRPRREAATERQMPKGQKTDLSGFSDIDRLTSVASLAKRVARVVSPYPPVIANMALEAAKRPEAAEPPVGAAPSYPTAQADV